MRLPLPRCQLAVLMLSQCAGVRPPCVHAVDALSAGACTARKLAMTRRRGVGKETEPADFCLQERLHLSGYDALIPPAGSVALARRQTPVLPPSIPLKLPSSRSSVPPLFKLASPCVQCPRQAF